MKNKMNIEMTHRNAVLWIKQWFKENGPTSKAVIGISGGKDSLVVAYLCVEALGKERVIGVLMPNHGQADLDDALAIVQQLDIEYHILDIGDAYDAAIKTIRQGLKKELTRQTTINLAPRIRTSFLYAIAQSCNGRVSNNSNASEIYLGYSTRWGDSVGDFAVLQHLTKTEVVALGHFMGIPSIFIDKAPSDGLSGKTDEDAFGFTYEELDSCIRQGVCHNPAIEKLHQNSAFKREAIPSFRGLVWE